jgi:predicted phage baseplate assembly protein
VPIPSPILDDRSYQQLRDELVRRIPVYTPEWTDHNPSDPGITLLELVAFLGENLLYRFNQIPEATLSAYLKLLQIPLRSAVPARAMLGLTTDSLTGPLIALGTEAKAGAVPYETLTECRAWPVRSIAVAKARSLKTPNAVSEPQVYAFAERALDALTATGRYPQGVAATYYENQTVPDSPDGLPVDFSATVDGLVWVAIVAGDKVKTAADRETLRDNFRDAILNLGFVPDAGVPTMNQVAPCTGGSGTPAPAVEWEISSGQMLNGVPRYARLTVAGDSTRGLTQQGVVRLKLPQEKAAFGPFVVADEDLAGTGDLPPSLDDETAAKVLFWLRAYRVDGTRPGAVQLMLVNATEVSQTRKALPEFLGTGTAQPAQRYRLVHRQVMEGSLVVEVEENPGQWSRWEAVDTFDASAPDDRHYIVDLEAGEVRFGTGLKGLAPQIGQRIRATEYRYGGGAAGNVGPKAISKLVTAEAVKCANPLPARFGADAESLAAGLERIPGELRRHDRAVTRDDFSELARATPGAAVGRAESLPRFFPALPQLEAAGVVSVVVWPAADPLRPNAPLPDRDLLRAVCEYLDQRRLVTTELYVIPPTYRKVAVSVGLGVKPGYGAEAVRRWVEQIIRQYLAPLPPFGPAGAGYPLGRRVYGPELEAVALQVEGVEFIETLQVAGWNGANWVPGTVELNKWEVPELTEITVVEGTPPPVGTALKPAPPVGAPVPVPVLRDQC